MPVTVADTSDASRQSGTYYNFYRPDATRGDPPMPIRSFYPAAAFATGPATAVDTTWTSASPRPANHMRISAADSTAPDGDTRVVNVLGTSNIKAGGEFVDILTNGFIGTAANPWREIVAVDPADGDDLRVGSIRSTTDDVFLLAPRGFVDADPADDDLTS